MIVKSYTAPTVAEALKRIKEELGGEAVVLKTNVCPENERAATGHRIEVTVCIDDKMVPETYREKKTERSLHDRKDLVTESLASSTEYQMHEAIDETTKSDHKKALSDNIAGPIEAIRYDLLKSDIDIGIIKRISDEIEKNYKGENLDHAAYEIIKSNMILHTTASVRIEKGMKVAFIGLSGSGKTSVLAKVAAQLCAKFKQKIKLVSIDKTKISASQEIGAYGQVLDLPVDQLTDMSQDDHDDTVVLIDTPPLSHDPNQQDELLAQFASIKPDLIFLVFSVCSRTEDLIEALNIFEKYDPQYLVASHLDETGRWGALMTMAEYLHTPVAFVTDTPGGIGELKSPDPLILTQRLLDMEADDES